MRLAYLSESVEFAGDYDVAVSGHQDQPTLEISDVGFIRLFYSGSNFPHYTVHMIRGETPGAATILYFAALDWALRHGIKDAHGQLASDLTLSPDAVRARTRFQTKYDYYLHISSHPDSESVKVHRGDNTGWRRKATEDEASLWRLCRLGPFEFRYNNG
jgi:hypothetical protein